MRTGVLAIASVTLGLWGCSPSWAAVGPEKCDDGGDYNVTNRMDFEQEEKITGQVRDFVWKHWSSKHCGVITLVMETVEGGVTTVVVSVQRNTCGAWVVLFSGHRIAVLGMKQEVTKDIGEFSVVTQEKPDIGPRFVPYLLRLSNPGDSRTVLW